MEALGGLAGVGGALAGLFGGGQPSQVQLPPQFQMPNMGQSAQNAFSGIQGLGSYGNLAQSTVPYAQQTFQNLYNNPYAGQAQVGADIGAGLGQQAAVGAYGTGQQFMNAGAGTIPYAQQIMQTGFDPQQALYNRTLQQTTDQERAGEAARGIATTPYGAGLENQALQNFNIDWQNQQLGRQAQAAQAAGGLLGQGAGISSYGTGLQAQAPGQFAQAAAMPYTAFSGIGAGQNQAINSLLTAGSGAQNISQVPIQDYLSYVQAGNQAGSVANQNAALALQQSMDQARINQMYGSALGSSLYGLGQSGFGNSLFSSFG